MKNFIKSAVTLAVVAALAGGLLVLVYKLTYVPYQFSLTPKDNAALAQLSDATSFGRIDHEEIKEENNIRYILRLLNGSNQGDYVIRATATGYGAGNVDISTMISASSGEIIGLAVCDIDTVGNNYYSPRVEAHIDQIFGLYIGKTSLGSFNLAEVDGVSGASAPITKEAIFNSIRTAINYYSENSAQVKAATPVEVVGLGETEDETLERIKQLYPNATGYDYLGRYSEPNRWLDIYMTYEGDLLFDYHGLVAYDDMHEGDEPFGMYVMFKFDGDVLDPYPVPKGAMDGFYDDSIDGVGGATATHGLIKSARSMIPVYRNLLNLTGKDPAIVDGLIIEDGYVLFVQGTDATFAFAVVNGEIEGGFVASADDREQALAALGGEENDYSAELEAARQIALAFTR